MWWLIRENDQLFLVVNGRRAFSRNRNVEFSRVKGMTVNAGSSNQQEDKILITFSDGNTTLAKYDQVDAHRLGATLNKTTERLQDVLSIVKAVTEDLIYNCADSDDSESAASSTDRENETREPQRKKRKTEENATGDVDSQIAEKCEGIKEVLLRRLIKPLRDGKEHSRKEIIAAKQFLMKKGTGIFQTENVLPVMADDSSNFQVLGGTSYVLAAKELVDDERYRHLLQGWRCRVYNNLNRIEALRVASLFRSGQPVEEGLSLQEEVAICRSLLYNNHGLEADAPPPKMTAPTRKRCAVALGRSDARNSLKALEPTFQLASYSNRCYRKVTELFNAVRETSGRKLKQFCFMKLQGLAEETRYQLLLQACTSLNIKQMMKDAEVCKAKKNLENMFAKGVGVQTWAEAKTQHPAHTTEEAMKPYVGLKWKKGMIPEAFLDHINSAKRSLNRDRPTDAIPALAIHEVNPDRPDQNAPAARTVIYLAESLKSLSGIILAHDVHIITIIVSEAEDLQEINHNVPVMYAAVESRMRGPGLLCMQKKDDIFEHAIRYYTCRNEYVVDVGDGLLARVALSCGRRICTPDAFSTPDTLVPDTPATIDPSEVEQMLNDDEPSHISDSELIGNDFV